MPQHHRNHKTVAGSRLQEQLKSYGWHPDMSLEEAEKALSGHKPYTFLIRPDKKLGEFSFAFVQPSGQIKHDHFRSVIPKHGIIANGSIGHVGPLSKVVLDMMKCRFGQGQPLL